MKVTPIDIRQQQFRSRWRGYDSEEVEAFLEAVAFDLEELLKERNDLQERVTVLTDELKEAHAEETEIKETLLAVHRVREDLVAQATKEAQLILKEARLKGDDLLRQCREELHGQNAQIGELDHHYKIFKAKLRALVGAHLRLLDDLSQNSLRDGVEAEPAATDGKPAKMPLAQAATIDPPERIVAKVKSANGQETAHEKRANRKPVARRAEVFPAEASTEESRKGWPDRHA